MKIRFTFAIFVAVALFGLASCNKNNGPNVVPENKVETGGLKITYTMTSETRALVTSTMKPTTTWSDNIKSLLLMFVDGSGIIRDSRILALPTAANNSPQTAVLTSVRAGNNYTVYLLANHDQPGSNITWTPAAVNGTGISSLLMSLATTPAATWTDKDANTEVGVTAYDESAEIFIATLTGVNVIQDVTTTHPSPLVLRRAVSLFRVRITPIANTNLTVDNTDVDFNNANASLRIRRAANAVTPTSVYTPATPVNTSMVYSKGFRNADPTTGYAPATGVMLDRASGQTHWKDAIIFPGGHDVTINSRFDIVVSGMAPIGYIPAPTFAGTASSPLTAPALVYWTGLVEKAVLANNIIEVNITLTSAGYPYVPPVVERGNIDFEIQLEPWGNINPTETDM